MKKFFKNLTKSHKGEKGFTLIELLIVIAILGILAAVAIPNVASFITSGKISGANSELANVQTANQAYAADNGGVFATASADLGTFLNAGPSSLKADYTFNASTGQITGATPTTGGWSGIHWTASGWVKGAS